MSAELQVVFIEGDGIGPEIVGATREVVDATGLKITWKEALAGSRAVECCGSISPAETLTAVARAGSAIKGPTSTPAGTGSRSANFYMRQELQLFGGVRRFVDRRRAIDVLLVRENLEDLYGAIEWTSAPGVTQAIKVSTAAGARRVAHLAFRLAREHDRERVTIVHKANNLKLTEGLFRETALEVASAYPEIACDELLADSAAALLAGEPAAADVLLATNTYGDLLSSVAAAAAGGPAAVSTANYGAADLIVAEAGHGSAPALAGRGLANPLGLLGGAAMLLAARGCGREAGAIWEAIAATRAAGCLTPDLGGSATLQEVTKAVASDVGARLSTG
ncbi:MAG TPA: isocitrate/isopropylmalate family dehydrogenase [Solirubrobacterales bacterium]|nr:isocitrate/isopropylmalate family dehydrogenase [Solirubrobacterales bacterium]